MRRGRSLPCHDDWMRDGRPDIGTRLSTSVSDSWAHGHGNLGTAVSGD